ncbi:hypothetical protein [Massilia sp. METH4]|uniref:hypothetical protein n=1 Tax=Massilia sp. METH4 TaxID=3123041 RepID=UPI0030D3F75B
MGLFSLFRKDKPAVEDDEAYARLAAESELQHDTSLRGRSLERQGEQRDSARAIVLKIDAIEAAMAADMFDEPAFRRPPRKPVAAAPEEGPPTEVLEEEPAAESAPAVEEAAILYANGQADEACRLLADAVAARPTPDRTAWWMLLDLCQLLGRQEAFDSLAIDYASTFDTAPPPWNPALANDAGEDSGVIPTVTLTGVLDAATAHSAGTAAGAADTALLRLDFSRLGSVEPEGCALLHDTLRHVQHGRSLVLVGTEELLAHLRASIDVGRRDEGEGPWLLLELLRLGNREKEFNEAATDYGLTFAVPPPPFTAPGKIAIAPREAAAPAAERYLLPRAIEGDAGEAWAGIAAYAAHSPAPVFDCSHLARIDYAAAGRLLTLLQQCHAQRIELRELNHPVAALLHLLGAGAAARLVPRRY